MVLNHRQSEIFQGLVVQTFNRFYSVLARGNEYMCQPKGILRQQDPEYRLPVIGDQVAVEMGLEAGEGVDGYILEICQRRNALARSGEARGGIKLMAANLDCVMVVSAAARPECDFSLIDRYLVSCLLQNLPAALVFNKIELAPEFLNCPELKEYRDLGYPVIETSVKAAIGLERLKAMVGGGITLLSGPSGVGKSSLINALVPQAALLEGRVAERGGLGRHTTTSSVLIPTWGQGFLADSPGLRDYYPPHIPPDQVRFGFLEIREEQRECRYASCCHIQEPDCSVRDAVRMGRISDRRYKSYRDLYFEMKNAHDARYH